MIKWLIKIKIKRKDVIKPEVLTLLRKAGINFEELRIKGISSKSFSEFSYGSGIFKK
jgi:hypothetical protein